MSRCSGYQRLKVALAGEVGIAVRIDWDHARGRDRLPPDTERRTTTLWTVEWVDGPTIATMRTHVERLAQTLPLAQMDVDTLRYHRGAQDVPLLALCIQYWLDHPFERLQLSVIENTVHHNVEHPERLDEPTDSRAHALYEACDRNLYRAVEILAQHQVESRYEWLDAMVNPPDNIVSLRRRRQRNPPSKEPLLPTIE